MIENNSIAGDISALMLECTERLNKTVELAQGHCNQTEFEAYRDAIGKIMGAIYFEVLAPIYERHPRLRPKELD